MNGKGLSKNLGIVMESADEGQALLSSPAPGEQQYPQGIMADGKLNEADGPSQNENETEKIVTIAADEHTGMLEIIHVEEGKLNFAKGRKKGNRPSRMERSRLSLITFLNNITVPTARESGKNRSQSMSSPVQQQFHGSAQQPIFEENDRKLKKSHRPTKSLGVEERKGQQPMQSATSTGNIATAFLESNSAIGIEKNCVTANLTDKLSIKSGASSTSSSGHVESTQSNSSTNSASGKHHKARECPICYVRQHPNNFPKLRSCTHLTCKTCLIKYLNLEIMESRTNISCPICPVQLQPSDIYVLLEHQPELLERFEVFSLRRILSTDPDARWCPAPDCTYAVIAHSCAACPQLKCERCETMFCYHCKNYWHPNQTCDQARSKETTTAFVKDVEGGSGADVTKACPRCGVQIMKMNDGSCNHMQCVLCNAEFCWLCLKLINELHYLSPTGCTFWGKKPWTRKKKLLWQIGTLIGAPLGIALIAGLAVPGIICGVPIFVGRKTYQRFSNLTKTKRQLVTALSVFGSLIVSPVLAVMTVGVGVPIMLAYVYGVVPLSLCRNGACGGSSNNEGASDDEIPYGDEVLAPGGGANAPVISRKVRQQRDEEKGSKSSFHHRRQSIASSGLVSLTDKPNTEDASIQAIAGSQYNYDNRSVHTIWSSGQYGGQLGTVELAQEATSYNNEDAENASTMACCSASIVAQASERRSLTGSNDGSFKNTRPRSSISNSNSRGNSEEAAGKSSAKFSRKTSRNNGEPEKIVVLDVVEKESDASAKSPPGSANQAAEDRETRQCFSFRRLIRHPVNSVFGGKKGAAKVPKS